MNWNQQAQNRVSELVEQIKFYISEGIAKEKAITIVRNETTISGKYWDAVLSQI